MSVSQMTSQTKVQSQSISTSNLYSQQVQQQFASANTTNLYSQQQIQSSAATNKLHQQSITNQYQQQQAATNQYQLQQQQQQQQQAATNLYQQQAATNQYQQFSNLNQSLDSRSDSSNQYAVRTVQEVETESAGSRALKPNFVKIPGDKEVTEGKMVRFDLRVSGRPFPDVLWYLNGKQVI